jgi:hypothetical protein
MPVSGDEGGSSWADNSLCGPRVCGWRWPTPFTPQKVPGLSDTGCLAMRSTVARLPIATGGELPLAGIEAEHLPVRSTGCAQSSAEGRRPRRGRAAGRFGASSSALVGLLKHLAAVGDYPFPATAAHVIRTTKWITGACFLPRAIHRGASSREVTGEPGPSGRRPRQPGPELSPTH